MSEVYERMRARIEREREIRCPFCDLLKENDDGQYPITYHGFHNDGEVHEMECDDCEKTFYVKEIVNRRWEEFKSALEAEK